MADWDEPEAQPGGAVLTPADPAWRAAIADMAEFVAAARSMVVLTGAGASTESGIPDFRSPNGIWARVAPTSYRAFLTSAQARREYWQLRREFAPTVAAARPNDVHYALAALERRGILAGILTQNFDGLHQAAGSSAERVVELHGTSREAACQSCGARQAIEPVEARIAAGEADPRCACGGLVKSATILFGQPLPPEALTRARELALTCDLFLVVGSSLRVNPAARLPLLALERRVPLLILNREPTRYDERADVLLHAQAGPAMRALLDALE